LASRDGCPAVVRGLIVALHASRWSCDTKRSLSAQHWSGAGGAELGQRATGLVFECCPEPADDVGVIGGHVLEFFEVVAFVVDALAAPLAVGEEKPVAVAAEEVVVVAGGEVAASTSGSSCCRRGRLGSAGLPVSAARLSRARRLFAPEGASSPRTLDRAATCFLPLGAERPGCDEVFPTRSERPAVGRARWARTSEQRSWVMRCRYRDGGRGLCGAAAGFGGGIRASPSDGR
jgi:hypothetical protein